MSIFRIEGGVEEWKKGEGGGGGVGEIVDDGGSSHPVLGHEGASCAALVTCSTA